MIRAPVEVTTRSKEHVIAAIQALDLDPIKFKLMDPEEGQGWSREYVNQMAIAYKRFLTLSVKYPEETIAPSKDVDKFWHGHILDTMKYAEDCQNVFGYFLHHFPYFGMRGEEDAANLAEAGRTTQRLYEQEFGKTNPSRPSMCAVAVAKDAPAMCAVAVTKDAPAMCAVAIQSKPAMCAVAVTKDDIAMCAVAIQSKPAMCAVAVTKDAPAMCAVAIQSKPAMCAVAVAKDAPAMCAVAIQSKPAMCAVAVTKDAPAMCAVAIQSKPAMCAVAVTKDDIAMCAVANEADSVTPLFGARKPAYRNMLKTSMRPR